MAYKDGSALLLGLIRDTATFSADTAAEENWKILNTGKGSVYAVLRPGQHTTEPVSIGQKTVHTTWNTVVELWTLYNDTAAPALILKDALEEIEAKIVQYPYLGDQTKVLYATTYTGEEMQERWLSESGPKWAVWELIVAWLQERSVTPAE